MGCRSSVRALRQIEGGHRTTPDPSTPRARPHQAYAHDRTSCRGAGPTSMAVGHQMRRGLMSRMPPPATWRQRVSPLVTPPGFEPGTCGLKVRCSAVELESRKRPTQRCDATIILPRSATCPPHPSGTNSAWAGSRARVRMTGVPNGSRKVMQHWATGSIHRKHGGYGGS